MCFRILLLLSMLVLASCNVRGGPFGAGWGEATALHRAAWADDAHAVRAAIASGVNPDAVASVPDQYWFYFERRTIQLERTPLDLAVSGNKLNAARALLDGGAKPGRGHIVGIVQDGEPMVRAFLDAGLDPNVRASGIDGQTALHDAVRYEKLEVVKLLLARGADPNARDTRGRTPLIQMWWPRGTAEGPEMVRVLLKAGADPRAEAESYWMPGGMYTPTPLGEARRAGRGDLVRVLEEALGGSGGEEWGR